MKDLPDNELIKLYIHEAARESSDMPFGAEDRRKAAGKLPGAKAPWLSVALKGLP